MENSTPGIGIAGALGIVFVVLKLVGVITWPWLWVLAPFWGPLALLGAGLAVFAAIYAVAKLLDHKNAKKVRTRGWEGGA